MKKNLKTSQSSWFEKLFRNCKVETHHRAAVSDASGQTAGGYLRRKPRAAREYRIQGGIRAEVGGEKCSRRHEKHSGILGHRGSEAWVGQYFDIEMKELTGAAEYQTLRKGRKQPEKNQFRL